MKAYYVKAPLQFELRDIELPALQPDEALVEVRACGVCGYDVITAQTLAQHWTPIGHELSGRIVELGSATRGFHVGQPVVVENSSYCGICPQCKRGNVVHCQNMDHFRSPGAFCEVIQVCYRALYPAEGLSYTAAALAEPLTVAIDMVEAAQIPLAGTVAVFGPGPIGLMICRLALLRGAARVYLTGHAHSRARWEAAHRLGVSETVFVDQRDVLAFFQEREPQGVDRVLVTAPPATVAQAAQITRFGGIIAYDGIKFGEGHEIVLDGNQFHFKRLQLRGVHSIPNLGWPQALELLRQRVIDPDIFVTQRYPFRQVPEAVRRAAEDRSEVIKVMVDWDLP